VGSRHDVRSSSKWADTILGIDANDGDIVGASSQPGRSGAASAVRWATGDGEVCGGAAGVGLEPDGAGSAGA
jgi:hypothetical protein